MTINMHSIIKKFSELQIHLSLVTNKVKVIIITESWLSKANDVGYELDGYKSISFYRDGKGGGIKVYYENSINIIINDNLNLTSNSSEFLPLTAHIPFFGKLNICSLYRPPNKPISEFLAFLD